MIDEMDTNQALPTPDPSQAFQITIREFERLHRSRRLLAEADNETAVIQAGSKILQGAPYPAALFSRDKNDLLQPAGVSDSIRMPANGIQLDARRLENRPLNEAFPASAGDDETPKALRDLLEKLLIPSATIIPIQKRNALAALILMAGRHDANSIHPYIQLADLLSASLERVDAGGQTKKYRREMEALASINELTSSTQDLQGFFLALLEKIHQIIGKYNLIVALYDEKSNSISVPFSYEEGKIVSIDSFPLGEGLTSILIRTRQPLMLVEDTERKVAELGAKVVGKLPRSWMGAPMLVHNNPIGALIIQDLEHDLAFNDDDLKFFTTIAGQVAGVIYSAYLLNESRRKALQVETAAEIARDISGSLDLDELLNKAVNLIRERFEFYHAAVFLRDIPGEFAVIRESTGEAGAQMKRSGYKIGVGSKSIVGFVSGRGEALVVNDTGKDATYYANPLLPDTRAEAAIPLRVGERILGVLDVQSVKSFAFSEDNLRSLQILADQLAVAVVNSELFAETQEHLSQHRLLHHITTTAASGTTLEEALESAVNGLQVTLGGDRVAILLVDREKKALEVKASVGYTDEIHSVRMEIGKGITGWVAAHRRPLRLRDVGDDPRYVQVSANTRSELAVPLVYRNELLGVLNVESEQPDAYTENDEEMLGTLGGSLAAVIANARLLDQIRAQSDREHLIYEVTSKIRRSTDIQSILMTTASEITRITGSRFTRVRIEPQEGGQKKDMPT